MTAPRRLVPVAQVKEMFEFLREQGIEPLGRYGRWQYLSMAQVIESGLSLGRQLVEMAIQGFEPGPVDRREQHHGRQGPGDGRRYGELLGRQGGG